MIVQSITVRGLPDNIESKDYRDDGFENVSIKTNLEIMNFNLNYF